MFQNAILKRGTFFSLKVWESNFMHVDTSTKGLHVVPKPGQYDLYRGHSGLNHFSLEMH